MKKLLLTTILLLYVIGGGGRDLVGRVWMGALTVLDWVEVWAPADGEDTERPGTQPR